MCFPTKKTPQFFFQKKACFSVLCSQRKKVSTLSLQATAFLWLRTYETHLLPPPLLRWTIKTGALIPEGCKLPPPTYDLLSKLVWWSAPKVGEVDFFSHTAFKSMEKPYFSFGSFGASGGGGVRRWLLYVRIWWSAPGGDTSAVIFFPSAPSVPVTLQVGVISQELVVCLGGYNQGFHNWGNYKWGVQVRRV